ncbi:MAG: O-antigen ligase family protein [Candidatus Aminicenantales bacterium]
MILINRIKGQGIWNRLTLLFLTIALLFSFISISLVQGFLTLSLISGIITLIRKERKLSFPSYFLPLLAYALLSLISSAFSVNPEMSFKDSKELLLILIVPLVYTGLSKKEDFSLTNFALLASASASILYSFFDFFFMADPGERIKGFMGHYMTQAGLLILFGALALSLTLFSRNKWKYLWGIGFVFGSLALALTLTRSAWIGLGAALFVIGLLWKPKSLILVPILAGLVFLVSPQTIKQRVRSIFSLTGYSNQERIEYLKAGIGIIKDFPLFGTGPDTVDMVFQNPKYGLSESAKRNVHLHNNFIQIAAERGLPTFFVWAAFLIWLGIRLLRILKNKDPVLYSLTAGALAGLAALVTAGFFEYNFGDSEITTLFLYLTALPFALHSIQERSSGPGQQK